MGCKKVPGLILIMLFIVLAAGCATGPAAVRSGADKVGTTLASVLEIQKAVVRPGSDYFLYPGPQPEFLGMPQPVVNGGTQVDVLEKSGEWVRIRQGPNDGWLPRWYLSPVDDQPVREISSGCLVLNRDAGGLLYPEGPKVVDLARGKLLNPVREWGDWLQVGIIVYDIPSVQIAWLPKGYLSPVDREKPGEGFLPGGTMVYQVWEYEKVGATASEKINSTMSVYVSDERDGYIRVNAAGGWSAWTKKENLKYGYD